MFYFLLFLAPRFETRLAATWFDIGVATKIRRDTLGHLRASLHAVPLLPGGRDCQFASAACAEHFQYLHICRVCLVRSVHRGSCALLPLCQGKFAQIEEGREHRIGVWEWAASYCGYLTHMRLLWNMPQVHFRHSNPFNANNRGSAGKTTTTGPGWD